jgi:rhamnosyltransferase
MNQSIESLNIPKICAVVTAFYPENIFLENMERVSAQVDAIVIIDNTASSASRAILTELEKRLQKIIIISNERNVGTIKALNQGIGRAEELGYQWVLTLDQDSFIDSCLIQTYLAFIRSYPDCNSLGVINSNYKDKDTGMLGFSSNTPNKNGWAEVHALITSGSLFAISTFKQIGPLREDFFMDWADYDFCLRARKFGKHNYVYIPPLIVHSIGAKTAHKILFLELPANNHNPFRCYLIGRNLTVVIKEYFFKEFGMAIFFICILFYKVFSVVLWEKDRKIKLRNFFLGLKDGLINKMDDHWRILKNMKRDS